jgi:tryptophanyl-tRNA synthetase
MDAVCADMAGKGYGDLKNRTSDAVIAALEPLQAEYKRLIADKQFLLDTLLSGAEKASYLATKTLRKVQKKVGFAPRSLK